MIHVNLFDIGVSIDDSLVAASPDEVCDQVREYARGDRRTFDVGVDIPDGFTGAVMRSIRHIPYGKTRTYGEIADELDTAAVAVGQACGRNPVPILVPCHRVVASDSIGGFSAGGEQSSTLKRRLLALERGDESGSRSRTGDPS